MGVFELFIVLALMAGVWLPAFGVGGTAAATVLFVGAAASRARVGTRTQRTGLLATVVLTLAAMATTISAIHR